jgi:hypothetical protein
MSLSTLRPKTQLALAIILPVVCILLGVVLLLPYTKKLRQTNQELQQTEETIQQKKRVITQAEAAAQGRSLALAVALPGEQEPIVFLRQFAALATESGVTLVSIRSTTPPPIPQTASGSGAPSGSQPQQEPGSPPPASGPGQRPVVIPPTLVRELTNEVTVEGRYGDILALIVRLENFERILSVSRCRINLPGTRNYPKLGAVFTVSRFIANTPPPSPGAAPTAQPATGAR